MTDPAAKFDGSNSDGLSAAGAPEADPAAAAAPPGSLDGATDTFGLAPRPKVRTKLADPLLGTDLGGVRIVRLLGEGGMGRVYEAWQEKPQRTVAVKVIRQGITSEKTLRRFEREAEFLAKLQHPGIAQIYVVGCYSSDHGDVPFYVMEFIADAKPVTNYCFEKETPLAERLRLFADVCDAVSHGHDRGIIHRDLKPGNILIDGDGRPRVIDFGVARSTDSDLTLTSMKTDSGHLMGTAQYMSPEQFGQNPDDLDPRADIYSLGVVLYELLAGVLPYEFGRKGIHEIARMVCETPPLPLRRRGEAVPTDAEAIVRKCLEKDRRDRYHSAGELAADLRRHLDGKPVHAGRGMLGRFARLRRLLPRTAAGRGLLLLGLLAAGLAITRIPGILPAKPVTRQVAVGADWVDTALAVEKDRCYRLVVTGTCRDSAGTAFGPDGTCPLLLRTALGPVKDLPPVTRARCVVGQHPTRAVIARIGDMAWSMHVGDGLTFIAPAAGRIELRINEPPESKLQPKGRLTCTLAPVAAPRFVDGTGATSVFAHIDELDYLLVKADGLQWEYGGKWSRVGMHEGIFPTLVNGIAWWPSWTDPLRSSVLPTREFERVAKGASRMLITRVISRSGRASIENVAGGVRIRFTDSGLGSGDVGCLLRVADRVNAANAGDDRRAAPRRPTSLETAVPDTLTNSVGITLKRIPAESPPNDAADPRSPPSRPARVTRPFHIGIYEVTNGQWNAVMGDARGDPREAAHPVEAFGLPEAMRFCRTLSELPEERKAGRVYRLPSEHEWEHACRAGTTTAWSCGDDEAVLVDHAWIRRNSDNRPHAVGGRKPNAWGLYDMHGNVMELCGSSRSLAAADAASAQEEPAKGEMLMMRGGNWLTEAVICRSGTRLAAPAVNPRTGEPVRMAGVGLRVAMDLTEPDDPDAPVRSSAGVAPAVRDRDAR